MDEAQNNKRRFLALLLVPALAIPALFAVALCAVQGQRAPIPEAEQDPAGADTRTYERVSRQVDIPLPAEYGRLGVDIVAVMVRREEQIIRQQLGPSLNAVTRTLAEEAMALAESLDQAGDLSPDLQALRAAFPEAMRGAINAELRREGLPPAVREILIAKWAVAPAS
ncbi:MAG: hypothetical protein AAGF60_03740 [Pseudomonadota bacterium]